MRAEILCVGTELLLGDIVNTNAAFIAQELAALGIGVYYQSVVGDNPERLKGAIDTAFARADILLMTGGLGPTYDDLTKETVAEKFGLPMEMHQESLEEICSYFQQLGRPMTDNNKKQAMMPKGAIVFHNDNGTAPGLAVEKDGKTAILMPGPPNEMRVMFRNYVKPYLRKLSGKTIRSHTIHLIGIGESNVEDMLRDMMTSHQNPTIAPYAKTGEVRLRVTASADSDEAADQLIRPVVEEISGLLGEYIYGIDVDTLENAAVLALAAKKLKVAVAESCTGGFLSKRLTDIPEASNVLDLGVCTYANAAKEKVLGVSTETLAQYGAVSEQTAREMAEGVRSLAGADIGISTTGIAGPGGGTEEKPVGLVYVGVSSKYGTFATGFNFGRGRADERDYIRQVAGSNALRLLIKEIEKY